jgi:hypothetical protein
MLDEGVNRVCTPHERRPDSHLLRAPPRSRAVSILMSQAKQQQLQAAVGSTMDRLERDHLRKIAVSGCRAALRLSKVALGSLLVAVTPLCSQSYLRRRLMHVCQTAMTTPSGTPTR